MQGSLVMVKVDLVVFGCFFLPPPPTLYAFALAPLHTIWGDTMIIILVCVCVCVAHEFDVCLKHHHLSSDANRQKRNVAMCNYYILDGDALYIYIYIYSPAPRRVFASSLTYWTHASNWDVMRECLEKRVLAGRQMVCVCVPARAEIVSRTLSDFLQSISDERGARARARASHQRDQIRKWALRFAFASV